MAEDLAGTPRERTLRLPGAAPAVPTLRALISAHPDAIIVADPRGLIRFANHAADRLLGRRMHHWTHDPRPHGEIRVDHPERGQLVLEVQEADIDWDDEPALLVCLHDVTVRRRREDEARTTAELALSIAEADSLPAALDGVVRELAAYSNSPCAIAWVADPVTGLLSLAAWHAEGEVCEGLCEGASLRVEASGGLPGRIARQRRAAWITQLSAESSPLSSAAVAAGLSCAMLIPVVSPQDDLVAVLGLFQRVERPGDAGRYASIVGLISRLAVALARCRDEQARHALDRAGRDADARRTSAELVAFADLATHDLREPLSIVTGSVQTLDRAWEGLLHPGLDELMLGAVLAVRRMSSVVDDLAIYAELDATAPSPGPVDCQGLLRELLQVLGPLLAGTGSVIDAGALPTVVADRPRLEHALRAALLRALRGAKEAPVRVHVGIRESAEAWTFLITDDGPPFAEGGPLSPSADGGLPGAICVRAVGQQGGTVWLEPVDGGNRLCFTVPKAQG